MSPPQLPRDVPVANVLQPVDVHSLPSLRQDANRTVAHCFQRRLRERFHFHEPLIRQSRLYNRVTTITMTNCVLMGLHFDQLPRFLECPDDSLTRLEPVDAEELRRHARVGVNSVRHGSVGRHDDRHRQFVPLTNLEVIGVVCRRDFQHAGAVCWIDVVVGNDGDFDVGDW